MCPRTIFCPRYVAGLVPRLAGSAAAADDGTTATGTLAAAINLITVRRLGASVILPVWRTTRTSRRTPGPPRPRVGPPITEEIMRLTARDAAAAARRRLPDEATALYRDLRSRRRTARDYLRTSTRQEHVGALGNVSRLFQAVDPVPGWFNLDDASHFWLVLRMQSALGVTGDLLEIGSYHGRSTAFMAACLEAGERLVVCDAFEADTEDEYRDKPSAMTLRANVARVRPRRGRPGRRARMPDSDLTLGTDESFRFVHVDGGHTADAVHGDLELVAPSLLPGGVIAVDDYHHPLWSEVHVGVDRWLHANPAWTKLADLNRHRAQERRELYLRRR